jgi:ribosome assembly protein 1
VTETTIAHLFVFMGASLELVDEVPAGNVVGIGGLDDILLKTGTLSTVSVCPNFTKTKQLSQGLVKVAIEAENLAERGALREGLIKIDRSDPSLEFSINSKGENILASCGEIHLERCLKDLKDDFAPGVAFKISEPIIPFMETITNKALRTKVRAKAREGDDQRDESSEEEEPETLEMFLKAEEERLQQLLIKDVRKEKVTDMYLDKILKLKQGQDDDFEKGCSQDLTANQRCKIKIRAVGMDFSVAKWLQEQQSSINTMYQVAQGISDQLTFAQDL